MCISLIDECFTIVSVLIRLFKYRKVKDSFGIVIVMITGKLLDSTSIKRNICLWRNIIYVPPPVSLS